MANTQSVYYLDGQIVDECVWIDTLNQCIALAQTRTHSSETKHAIRVAILSDIESGRGSIVRGHEFQKNVKVML